MKKLTVNERIRVEEETRKWIFDNTRKITMSDISDRVFYEIRHSEYFWGVTEWRTLELNAMKAYIISCETEMVIPRSGC